jgi:plasmid stability protein
MAQLVVRNLPEAVKDRLKRRAKSHGRSLEAEVRAILEETAKREEPKPGGNAEKGFGTRMAALFKDIGLTEVERRQFDRRIDKMRRSNPPRFAKFDE